MMRIFLILFCAISLFPIELSSAVGDRFFYNHEGVNIQFTVTGETPVMHLYPGTVSVGYSTDNSYSISISPETIGKVTIPSQITYKGNKYNITTIANYAFKDCKNVDTICISEGITHIGQGAFWGCSALVSVDIPESVTNMGEYVFANCSSLASINLPKSISHLPNYSFVGCTNLKTLDLSAVYSIGVESFRDCKSLESIEIWARIISTEAFASCISLNSVKFKGILGSLDYKIFEGCSQLKNIYIYEMPHSGFWGSSHIEAFSGIPTDATLYVPYGKTSEYKDKKIMNIFSKIRVVPPQAGETFVSTIPLLEESISIRFKVLDDYLMEICIDSVIDKTYNNREIEQLIIPSSIIDYEDISFQIVGIDSSSFKGFNAKSISFPNGLRYIRKDSFKDCLSLSSINIPENITTIEDAFPNSVMLDSVYVYWRKPDSQEVKVLQAFDKIYSQAKLCVPAGTYDKYATHEVWGNFSKIIESSPISIGEMKTLLSSTIDLPVNLRTSEIISGIQFKLTLPQGVFVAENSEGIIASMTERSEGFTMMGNKDLDSENSYLFVSLSLDGDAFKGDEGTIFKIRLDVGPNMELGDYDMIIEDIHMVTTNFETLSPLSSTSNLSIVDMFDLIYVIDGVEYKRIPVINGDSIVKETIPVKEGHTFSGWSEEPLIMPKENLTIVGSFIPNKYQISYVLDGNIYQVDSILYGEDIIVPDVPIKEWHSFEGWGDIPEKMPAKDLSFEGGYSLILDMGDVNGDNRISIVDITILTNEILKKENETFIDATADINGDGRISVIDITMITNKIIER